jgi:RNA polymerase sigma factor (TIGR02999 family)
MDDSADFTWRLRQWRDGDGQAGQELFRVAYDELHRLAALHFRKEPPGQTLQPTALVNELYMKLFAGASVDWQNRAHFFAVASQQIRRLLIDHARARQSQKREGDRVRISITK